MVGVTCPRLAAMRRAFEVMPTYAAAALVERKRARGHRSSVSGAPYVEIVPNGETTTANRPGRTTMGAPVSRSTPSMSGFSFDAIHDSSTPLHHAGQSRSERVARHSLKSPHGDRATRRAPDELIHRFRARRSQVA